MKKTYNTDVVSEVVKVAEFISNYDLIPVSKLWCVWGLDSKLEKKDVQYGYRYIGFKGPRTYF